MQRHFAEYILQQAGTRAFQPRRIAGHQLFRQASGDRDGTLGNQTADFCLAFHANQCIGQVINAQAVLVAVTNAVDLVQQRLVVIGIEIQRTDMVFVAFCIAVGIAVQHPVQRTGQQLAFRRIDIIF